MILVAGGAGYIGSHTCVELCENGYEVIIADNFCNSDKSVVDRLQNITGEEIKCYEVDIADYEQLKQVFYEVKIDSIINFAGFKAVGESSGNPLRYYENNLSCMINLCKAMEEYRVDNVIFSSSATVYGGGNPPFKETDRLQESTNPYGETKKICERILMDFYKSNKDINACILRYFNPVGAHPSGMIGEDPRGIPNNLMPLICKVASGEIQELKIYGDDYPTIDGTGIRDYIHIVDLARGHVAALDYLRTHHGLHTFNLGTGKGTSVFEMVNRFMEENKVNIPYSVVGRRPGDVTESYASVDKANNLLNWRAKYAIEDMVRDAYNYMIRNQ